ncbi:MAG: hypothetical protein HYX73_05295 [Acidobacteria bacterium]|nr:hypothetical protein [Acidobacteriota bacterium]
MGLKAVVVVDNTACGAAVGRARMGPGVNSEDACRLAHAMTLKSAAGLPHGGGPSVIFADPKMPSRDKEELIRAFAWPLQVSTITFQVLGTDKPAMVWVKDEIGRAVGLPREFGGIALDEPGASS